jgi:hypothetical protein
MVAGTEPAGTGMCLLCEELWMAFEPPPEAKVRTFMADAPQPNRAEPATEQPKRATDEADAPESP